MLLLRFLPGSLGRPSRIGRKEKIARTEKEREGEMYV